MGCTDSKQGSEEVLQICRDRKNFIKQAIELRNRFASDHLAYTQSLKRVSAALIFYVEDDDVHDFFFESFIPPPLKSLKKLRHETRGVHQKSLKPKQKEPVKDVTRVMYHLRSGGNPSGSVEEEHEQKENVSRGSYYSSPVDQSSLWDLLWNLFPSLDSYGYPSWTNYDGIVDEDVDGVAAIRKIREEEGIPELESLSSDEEERTEYGKQKTECKHAGVQVGDRSSVDSTKEFEEVQEINNTFPRPEGIKPSKNQGSADFEGAGFAVHADRRAKSMAELMKDMERQFMRICESSSEVSEILEASRDQNSHVSKELEDSSATIRQASTSSKDDRNEGCCDNSEMYFMVPKSHQVTLERLYEWEKKLYEEVKAGERVRIAHQKKYMQLKSHDTYGEEPCAVEQTINSIRDLYTNFEVYIHTIESISKRIEALRDEELCPQLMELIKRLSFMWKTMADGHRIQKCAVKDAKLLVISGAGVNPSKPHRCAAILAAEICNWSRCLQKWINGMHSYAKVLSKWASRSVPLELTEGAKLPQMFGVCTQWSRLLDSVSWKRAVYGMEFFATGMASVSAQQLKAEGTGLPPKEAAAVAVKIAEIGPRVLCVGMSVAVGLMAELAVETAQGYDAVLRRRRDDKRQRPTNI